VLKTQVIVSLGDTFPGTLKAEDFSVNATSTKDPNYVRYMNVLSVDQEAKTLRTMFGGAESGVFQVTIRHKEYGLVDTAENMLLDVSSRIISISPKIGSIYGGTVVTIKGTNFSTVKTDNPVQISTHGGVGSIDCYVLTTKADEITCRVETKMDPPKEHCVKAALVVFLKVSEESICDEINVCNWEYSSNLPSVTEMTTEFDADREEWQVKVTGTNFEKLDEVEKCPEKVEPVVVKPPVEVTPETVIPESADYNKAYNTLALAAHNKYRKDHQVNNMIFDADAAKGA
jgi:hypothetical protein